MILHQNLKLELQIYENNLFKRQLLCYSFPMKKTAAQSVPANKSPMDAALGYLTARMRTVREVEEYLDKLQYGEGDIILTVARLKELGLLNDEHFAQEFVRTRLNTKPVSRNKLNMDLQAHKVPEDIIDETLSQLPADTERNNALAVAEKFWRQMSALDDSTRRERVLRRLMSRGFSTEASLAVLRQIEEKQ